MSGRDPTTAEDAATAAAISAAVSADASHSVASDATTSRERPFAGRIAAVAILAFAAILAVATSKIEYAFSSDPLGPKAFPGLLAIALGVFGIWYFLRPGESEAAPDRNTIIQSAILIGATALAVGTMPAIGFPISAAVMCGVCAYFFGASPQRAALIGIAQSAFWFVIFRYLLGTYLPLGTLLFPGQ